MVAEAARAFGCLVQDGRSLAAIERAIAAALAEGGLALVAARPIA